MLSNHFVRLEKVEIHNFKNVKYGMLDMNKSAQDDHASIVGVFGQNGSGKTAVLEAIELLRYALSGQVIPQKFVDYIQVDTPYAEFDFEFKICSPAITYGIEYRFKLSKVTAVTESNADIDMETDGYQATITDEILRFRYTKESVQMRMTTLIDTTGNHVPFSPEIKYDVLVGKHDGVQKIAIIKAMSMALGRSFIFSADLLAVIRKNCTERLYTDLLEALVQYGNFELFVISTSNTGVISMNGLPFAFHLVEKEARVRAVGQFLIPINGPAVIPQDQFIILQKMINSMNLVLDALVPGLQIAVKDLGQSLLGKTSVVGEKVELVSCKNSEEIPLKYESEGIKKIISILQLFIEIYNKPSVTVVVDELDAGIFEYLLGEMLSILFERGKGQLIFTSHNLRPLETLPVKCIAFTTTDPNNRYVRMTNLKKTNNLRSSYYRNIILGNDKYSFYDETDNYKIALAFRKAGMEQKHAAEVVSHG